MTTPTIQKVRLVISVCVILVLAALAVKYYSDQQSALAVQQQEQLRDLGFYYFDRPRSLSDVVLSNLQGQEKPFTQHLSGWRLVNFGYMFCPDICPINLSLLSTLKSEWEQQTDFPKLEILHLTFDPKRDKPDVLQQYLTYINPSFYGLTGTLDNIRRVTQQLNVLFIHEKPDEQGNYFITHSDSIALINPEGQYIGMFKGPYTQSKMFEALKLLLASKS